MEQQMIDSVVGCCGWMDGCRDAGMGGGCDGGGGGGGGGRHVTVMVV